MRIVSGKNRGLKLKSLEGIVTRPTLDRVKESMFNTIESILIKKDIEILNILDLFAGSGALGLEAISRYNCNCVFVDNNSQAINIVKQNIINTKALANSKIYNLEYLKFFEYYKNSDLKNKFDLIFLDPPYKFKVVEILNKIIENDMLNDFGIIVYETDNIEYIKEIEEKLNNENEGISAKLELLKIKKYGRIYLAFIIQGE